MPLRHGWHYAPDEKKEYTCPTCGATPCANRTFCRACRKADARIKRTQDWAFYRWILEPHISFERAWAMIQMRREKERLEKEKKS